MVNSSTSHHVMAISLQGTSGIRPLMPGVDPSQNVRRQKRFKDEQKKKSKRKANPEAEDEIAIRDHGLGENVDITI